MGFAAEGSALPVLCSYASFGCAVIQETPGEYQPHSGDSTQQSKSARPDPAKGPYEGARSNSSSKQASQRVDFAVDRQNHVASAIPLVLRPFLDQTDPLTVRNPGRRIRIYAFTKLS
ncbi:hypothetical protein DL767_009236 [Monosporascus sp. MG133]|nr:hypothetical protein DL767_009236 [Monosporascus sp. MG133]